MTDRIGQELGHYKLIQQLGSGGFAEVYLAEHIYLNTLAAVKLLNTSLMSGDVQNFHNEARTIAKLTHPHIVRVLDFGLEENSPYLVMEYASDGTLRQRHPRRTQVPLAVVVKYVRQIASALQYAHTNRLIHRDVKPENILLGNNQKLLLGDFGAALLASTSLMFSTQNIIGTMAYMAPEQLRGKAVAASDQYALGIVVYEWLCGYCPFQGTLAELNNLHLYEPPPSLCARIAGLSPTVEHVVMKALAKQPEQRYPTIWDFAQALERASQQTPVPVSPLYLRGQRSSPNQVTMLGAGASLAPHYPQIPPPPPTAAPPLAPTMPVEYRRGGSQARQSRVSRRVFVGSLMGLAAISAIGGGGTLGWFLTHKGTGRANQPNSQHTPVAKATPVPTKSKAHTVYNGHRDTVFSAAWSPNDEYIASAGGNIGTQTGDDLVHVWHALTGEDVNHYSGHSKLVRMVAWSPDGTRIASASEDKTVQVWDALTGDNSIPYSGHSNEVLSLAWSPDGANIVSSSAGTTGNVQVWDANSGNLLFPYNGHGSDVTSVVWSQDGQSIASADKNGKIQIWDAQTGETKHTFTQETVVGCLSWSSSDNNLLATGDYNDKDNDNDEDNVRVWDISKGVVSRIFPGAFGNLVYTVAWSPDGTYIVAGYQYGIVNIWQYATGKPVLVYTGHNEIVMDVQWSHSGKYIASCGFDGTVQIWTMP